MPTTKKYKSKTAAVETLRRFFGDEDVSDYVSLPQIFKNTGREQKLLKANLAWLSNKLITLRYHNLINAEYSYDGRRRLEGISLTLDGKRVMGRARELYDADNYTPAEGQNGLAKVPKASIDSALTMVTELKKMYPDYNISLTVKPKTDDS